MKLLNTSIGVIRSVSGIARIGNVGYIRDIKVPRAMKVVGVPDGIQSMAHSLGVKEYYDGILTIPLNSAKIEKRATGNSED